MNPRYIYLNNSVTIPGTKILGANSIQPDKHPKAKLELGPEGLLVQEDITGSDGTVTTVTALIPMSNIQLVVFEQVKKSVVKAA